MIAVGLIWKAVWLSVAVKFISMAVGILRESETKKQILAVWQFDDLPRTVDTIRVHVIWHGGSRFILRRTARRLVKAMARDGELFETGGNGSGLWLPTVPRCWSGR